MNGTSYLKLLICQSYLPEWTLTKSLIIPPKNSNILCDTGFGELRCQRFLEASVFKFIYSEVRFQNLASADFEKFYAIFPENHQMLLTHYFVPIDREPGTEKANKKVFKTLGMRKRSLLAGRAQISRAKNRDLLSCE